MHRRLLPVAFPIFLAGLVLPLACQKPGALVVSADPDLEGPPIFEDVTVSSQVLHFYRNGEEADQFSILETLGGGVALIDYDGDGLLDIFLTGGGRFTGPNRDHIEGAPCRLFRNLGNWRFEDVTEKVGLAGPWFYSHGAAVADYDGDGWPDLLVTGYDGLMLFRNVSDGAGGRKFVDVTREVGLPPHPGWCTSAAFGDLDGDGFPELYVCRYVNWSFANNPPCQSSGSESRDVCTPRVFDALPHFLFANTAGPNGRAFSDISRFAGLRQPRRADRDYGKGLGVLIADLNGDGRPDIYVANDTTDNFLYLNEGAEIGPKFREVGLKLGVARDGGGTPNGSMGADAADYDGCGRPSLWVTNYEGELHALYRSIEDNGRRYFQFSSQNAGTAAIGQLFVGFGTAFLDYDGDGWEDLIVSNGHVLRYPSRSALSQRPVLFHNLGDGRFRDISPRGGAYFRATHRGRGLAVGDLDNDGRPDVVISHVNEPVTILHNVALNGDAWLGIQLVARDGRDVVGAKATLELAGRKLTRFAKGGGSYLSSSDRRILFHLDGPLAPGKLTVEWPRGEPRVQTWENLPSNRYVKAVQGKPTLEP